MWKFRKICITILLGVSGCIFATSPAHAVKTTFKQQIVPIDCVFQDVNDGTGTVIYLTPAACGQIINPPPGEPETPALQQVQQQFNPNRVIFFAPTAGKQMSGQVVVSAHLPYHPIATVKNEGNKLQLHLKLNWALSVSAALVIGVLLLVFIFAIL